MDKRDKELNRVLDRLAAGEKITPRPGMPADMQEDIETAEKLLACTADPSPQFQENLKRRVMNLLKGQQVAKEKSPGWLERLAGFFTTPTIWRTATVAVTVGALALLAVWAAGLLPFQSPGVPPVIGTGTPALIKVEPAAPGVISAPLGAEVRVELLFRNTGSEEVRINPFPPEIQIHAPLSRAPVRVFNAGVGEFAILSSGKAAYTLIWDQRDATGSQAPAGTYLVSVVNISATQGSSPQPTAFDAVNVAQIEITTPAN